jgi:threonylcarbamoyladenosine tRNA methylthiotransferase MtaB
MLSLPIIADSDDIPLQTGPSGRALRTVTLGCKVNQYETELVREGLVAQAGYRDADEDEAADLCVVNTCTVTEQGDSKSRQTIRQLAKRNPNSRIVVMGCYATRAPEEVRNLPNVVEVVTDKREIPDLLGRWGVLDPPNGISTFANHQRAFIKIQDGCLLNCSFCIIPHVRPNVISRPAEHIIDEVQRLLANGYREFVLTGIHLGHYGVEQNQGLPKEKWQRLSRLLERLMQIDGDFRIRLSSIECTEITRELIDVCAANPERIAPHFHVCLQSGSEKILRSMKRRWGPKRFIDRCRMINEALDRPALTTDIIVGFPGETEADFQETLDVSREVGFSKIHIFPYSPRRGTEAALFTNQVSPEVRQERCDRLAQLDIELRDAYFEKIRGTKLRVLVENPVEDRPGWMHGTSCRFATVELPGTVAMRKQFADVTAGEIRDGRIIAASH